MNTIVSSVVIFTLCGLWLALMASPNAVRKMDEWDTAVYLENEYLLQTEAGFLTANNAIAQPGTGMEIYQTCETIKKFILDKVSGSTGSNSGEMPLIRDGWISWMNEKDTQPELLGYLQQLDKLVNRYNDSLTVEGARGDVKTINLIKTREVRSMAALNNLFHIQMFVLQQERKAGQMQLSLR